MVGVRLNGGGTKSSDGAFGPAAAPSLDLPGAFGADDALLPPSLGFPEALGAADTLLSLPSSIDLLGAFGAVDALLAPDSWAGYGCLLCSSAPAG